VVASIQEPPTTEAAAEITGATWTIGGVKAIEYAILGVGVALLLKRKTARVIATQDGEAVPMIVGTAVNELFVPMACSLILYSAARAGRYVRSMAQTQPVSGAAA
jgi:hypothetical protein